MTRPLFAGVGVALVTLFDDDGEVAAKATAEHAARLVELGMRAVVVAGSTGEAASLTDEERTSLLTEVRQAVPPETPVLAGTGAPSTRQAVALTRAAVDHGADGVLVLSPAGGVNLRGYYEAVAARDPGRAAGRAADPGAQGLLRRPRPAARRVDRVRWLALRRVGHADRHGRPARLRRRDPRACERGTGAVRGRVRRDPERPARARRGAQGRAPGLPPRPQGAGGRPVRHLARHPPRLTPARLGGRSAGQRAGGGGASRLRCPSGAGTGAWRCRRARPGRRHGRP